MAIGNIQAGQYFPMTASQDANVKADEGVLLGFYASVAGTASIYDDAATGTTTAIGTALVINAGWNPIPVAFGKGLHIVLTTAAGTAVFL